MKLAVMSVALGLSAAAAHAEQGAAQAQTEAVVVTATRTPQPLAATIRPVDVVLPDTINEAGQQTLAELLQTRTNAEIASTGGYGQPSSVFLRGANSNHTLVLLDGIRMNTPLVGLASFENLRGNQFSRIEVVPGPLSSLYGSEAVGGVIQLFTNRWPDAPRVYGYAGYGTWATSSLYGGLSGGTDRTGISVNAGYFESTGFSATNPQEPFGLYNPDTDGHRNTNFTANVSHRVAPAQEIGLNVFYTEGLTHFDAGPTTDDTNRQRIGVYSAYSRNQLTDRWSSLVKVGVAQDQISTQGAYPGSLGSQQTQATWQNDFRTRAGTVIAGLEYLQQKVNGQTAFAVDQREIYSGFLGYAGQFGPNIVQASVRYDNNSQFQGQTTGTIGYAYRFTEQLRARASAGTGFHAPTFADLYYPGFGNPDLQPEKSRSWEIGGDYLPGRHRFGVTYFQNHIEDLILVQAPTYVPMNVSAAQINGLELTYQAALRGFDIGANLTLQNAVNSITDKRLPRRAQVFGNIALTKRVGRWRIGAEVAGAGDRYDSVDENPTTKLDPYVILNLLASWAFAPKWNLDVRWNNVGDASYALAQGYNTPRSSVFVAVKYELR